MAMMKQIYSEVTEMYFDGVASAVIAARLALPVELVLEIVQDAEDFEVASAQLALDY